MSRMNVLVSAVAAAAVLFTGAPAQACGDSCECPHGAKKTSAKKAAEAKAPTSGEGADDAAHVVPAKTAPAANAAGVLGPVDEILAATCSCKGAGDCTCKKGQCKCKKCSKHHQRNGFQETRLIEPVNGVIRTLEVPQNARYDATGGVAI